MLKHKKILLGITSSIAAYKAAILVRGLIKAGAEVKVIMTPASTEFVQPLTFSVLSKNQTLVQFTDQEGNWNNHVDLGLWADLMLIAPCSANTLGKMTTGVCDNLLLATYLSAKCPVMIAPAMDLDMYKHFTTVENLSKLKTKGVMVIPSEKGELASGLEGEGRMAEPENIIDRVKEFFKQKDQLKGKRFLVTAGPTYESIDPVRFIGNHSSGKMGLAICKELKLRGAEVTLVKGPVDLPAEGINTVSVTSAEEMYQQAVGHFNNADVAILAAAVADYTPVATANEKIKKSGETLTIELRKTKDILAELGAKKSANQKVVGFALETNNEIENARKKLFDKKADAIILNSLKDQGAGFKTDTNRISILDQNNITSFELKSKQEVAADIVDYIIKHLL